MPTPPAPSKRLCVFSDGTWRDAESPNVTNIVRLANAVSLSARDAVPQVVHYDPGVGADVRNLDRLRGGAFGEGIDHNLQQLYTFLANNYQRGDEVYMFGYSRGAYTVRSLAGFIAKAGLVRRGHLDFVKEAYELYRDREIRADDQFAVDFRAEHGDSIPIKLVACFDTVGSLGLPFKAPWPLSLFVDDDRYAFHDTVLSEGIENAIHCLSIDEDRYGFRPTYMQPCRSRGSAQLTELFFPGFHSGVGGGGESEQPLADNTMRFVVDEIAKRKIPLAFDMDKVPEGGHADVPPLKKESTGLVGLISYLFRRNVRDVGSVDRMHPVALKRFAIVGDWRPPALSSLKMQILERALKLFN